MARGLILVLVLLLVAMPAGAAPPGQKFVAIGFHEIVDSPAELDSDSVTTRTLVQFFDWLKGNGWTPVSLDDLAAAASGRRALPDKAILLTFDDGFSSHYTRVFPLLKAYNYPAVFALVGSWMEDTPDGTVPYGDKRVPRTDFMSWAQAREMQSSGLAEFASHTYDMHRGQVANPQGNVVPAAASWRYDPKSRTYEDDAQYSARIRADLLHSITQIQAELGRRPRAIVWPYGRYTGPGIRIAEELGLSFGMTLESEPAYTSTLSFIPRYMPSGDPKLRDLVENLRFEARRPMTLRVACLSLDALAAPPEGAEQDKVLGHMVDGVRALGANTVVIDAAPAPPSAQAPLGEVYFPTDLLPMQRDVLSRATWQIGTRGDADMFIHLPLAAAAAAVGVDNVPSLFADMARHSRADGVVIDLPQPPAGEDIEPNLPADIRARRAALDAASLERWTQLGLAAFRAAAAINPRLHLMVAMGRPGGPPDWADLGLLPPTESARETVALVSRLKNEGWLRPDVAGRVAISLPQAPNQQIGATRLAQGLGASSIALCPKPPTLPPSAPLAAAFSSATYPHRP